MGTLTNYLSENALLSLVFVVIAIVFIVVILKSLFKIAMIIVVIGLTLVVFFDFKPQEVMDGGEKIADTGKQLVESNLESKLLHILSEQDFLVQDEDGDTFIEIKSLGLRYQLNDLLNQLQKERENEINELIEMIE